MQGCQTLVILDVEVGAARDEQPAELERAKLGRRHERCPAITIRRVHVDARRSQQRRDRLGVASIHRRHERRVATIICLVHIEVRSSQQGRGPGYQRMRSGNRSAERGARPSLAEPVKPAGLLAVGIRIFHQKFGYGTVRSNEGGKLEIDFEKAGTKKVMESFVEPA